MTLAGRLEAHPPPHHHHHHHHQQHPLPILRMKLHWPMEGGPPPPAMPGSPPQHQAQRAQQGQQAQQEPTLDVLVQPLALHYRPRCLLQLQRVLPAVLTGRFHEALLAAVNGLSSEARATEKAAYLHYLGPPMDVLVKVRWRASWSSIQ